MRTVVPDSPAPSPSPPPPLPPAPRDVYPTDRAHPRQSDVSGSNDTNNGSNDATGGHGSQSAASTTLPAPSATSDAEEVNAACTMVGMSYRVYAAQTTRVQHDRERIEENRRPRTTSQQMPYARQKDHGQLHNPDEVPSQYEASDSNAGLPHAEHAEHSQAARSTGPSATETSAAAPEFWDRLNTYRFPADEDRRRYSSHHEDHRLASQDEGRSQFSSPPPRRDPLRHVPRDVPRDAPRREFSMPQLAPLEQTMGLRHDHSQYEYPQHEYWPRHERDHQRQQWHEHAYRDARPDLSHHHGHHRHHHTGHHHNGHHHNGHHGGRHCDSGGHHIGGPHYDHGGRYPHPHQQHAWLPPTIDDYRAPLQFPNLYGHPHQHPSHQYSLPHQHHLPPQHPQHPPPQHPPPHYPQHPPPPQHPHPSQLTNIHPVLLPPALRAAVPKKRKGSWKIPPAAAKAKAKRKTPVRRKMPAKSPATVPSDADLTDPEPIEVESAAARRTKGISEQPTRSPSVIEIPDSPVQPEQVAKSPANEGKGAAKTTETAQGQSVEVVVEKGSDEASHVVVEKELAKPASEQVAEETAEKGETEVVEEKVEGANGKEATNVSPTFADRFMW